MPNNSSHGDRATGKIRSLRDLDLNTRLLRYPLSYLVYSDSFERLPELARDYVFRRFQEILEGQDVSEEFSHLSDAQRGTLMQILLDTKPSFRKWMDHAPSGPRTRRTND